ncbi:mechanosensitive ion channel family protein [Legionella spiritensis]|nr:mechanosensitive ion channel domain-containing protein [Legionella spiritensis]
MRIMIVICLLFLCTFQALGETSSPVIFDIKNANEQFDHINLKLSIQNLNLTNLSNAVDTLTELSVQADQCVDEMQKKLNSLDILIKQAGSAGNNKGADLVYLNNQHKELADIQSQCRLFSIRAKEAIDAYKTAINQLKQEKTLTRGTPLWQTIKQLHRTSPDSWYQSPTLNLPKPTPSLLFVILGTGAVFLGSTILLARLRKSQFVRRYLHFKILRFSHIVLLGFFFITGALLGYLLLFTDDPDSLDPLLLLTKLTFFYLMAWMLIIFLSKIKSIRAFFYWYALDTAFFQKILVVLLGFYFIAIAGPLIAELFHLEKPVSQLCQSAYLLLILGMGGYFIRSFCRTHHHLSFIKKHYYVIQIVIFLLLLTFAVIGITGYHALAMQLTLSGFITFAILFVTILIKHGINKLYVSLSYQHSKRKIMKLFGYRKDQIFIEFYILKIVLQLITVLVSIYLIGISWGFALDFLENTYDKLLYGFHLANITIYPTRIISGVVIFCILYLAFRAISTTISRHQQFEDEEETQVAIASILNYIGFGLAILSGLLIAGFNFTGLAIIAGALSVGIGLGLQSIVNNFVSGLILLIEKPIRPGDRINIDGVEGFVKKIRVRSTQILTPYHEDIIIPNSDLITHRVVNYMFSDNYWRVGCEVGVAYGSDIKLVQELLLDIANKHEDVVKTGRQKPMVIFNAFGDNALMFQLWCLIKDVNKKWSAKSELNFAIDEVFRQHNISIAFPQRDLHIKLEELEPLIEKIKPQSSTE